METNFKTLQKIMECGLSNETRLEGLQIIESYLDDKWILDDTTRCFMHLKRIFECPEKFESKKVLFDNFHVLDFPKIKQSSDLLEYLKAWSVETVKKKIQDFKVGDLVYFSDWVVRITGVRKTRGEDNYYATSVDVDDETITRKFFNNFIERHVIVSHEYDDIREILSNVVYHILEKKEEGPFFRRLGANGIIFQPLNAVRLNAVGLG